jgi:DNA-binding NarL/FixJ family response regulator
MTTRILLADDHSILKEGLKLLLQREPDFSVVGEASNGHEALDAARNLHPNVVIMDLSMPELNGIEATRMIHEAIPETRIIVLSAYSDRNRILEALRSGASGYVLKSAACEELVAAVRKVLAGETYLGERIQDAVAGDELHDGPPSKPRARLSDREREVLQLLAEGKAIKEAAAVLHLSTKTVETHRRSIMGKLNMYSIAELTKHAIREGLTTLEH